MFHFSTSNQRRIEITHESYSKPATSILMMHI
ncbi:hypothetical protein DESC_700158 [Desulfosarcina cetonica]|nr:hypothetical protein DESC_700158 [Desulfosarcina cetonica]